MVEVVEENKIKRKEIIKREEKKKNMIQKGNGGRKRNMDKE